MVQILSRSRRKDSAASSKAADDFWGRLINDEGKGTQLMWRLADSVFFYSAAQTRVWHGIDASQLFWLLRTAALEDDDTIDARIYHLARYLDDAGIHHTPVIVNGQQVPTMDRTAWFQLMCREARTTPEYAQRWWTNLILALPLQDPHTHRPFPAPPPRWAFPGSPDPSPATSTEGRELGHGSARGKKGKSKTLLPENHEPDYCFLPRMMTTADTTDQEKKAAKERGKLYKVPRLFGSDKARLAKERPPPQQITFVADGRMRKAHARSDDGNDTPLPPRPSTATGHYEIPRAHTLPPPVQPESQRRWPDTRGLPQLSRQNAPPPSSFTPISRGRTPIAHSPVSASSRSRSASRSRTRAAVVSASPDEGLVPVAPQAGAVDISTDFGPGGEAMQSVVSRALGPGAAPGHPRRPMTRRHSSDALINVEKTESREAREAYRMAQQWLHTRE